MTQDTSATRLEDLKKCKTLCEFVPLRARQIPQTVALRQYDRKEKAWKDVTYASLDKQITAWRRALEALHLERGARVAILLNNSVDAVLADQAVLANGLIPVPLHAIDTPGSSAFILIDSQSSALITNKADRWGLIEKTNVPMPDLKHVILTEETGINEKDEHRQILSKDIWLASGKDIQELPEGPKSEDLAAIVYTSGTTGRPKGVMLTHHNVVENVIATLIHIAPAPKPGYVFLSFLPLSHTFERTAGYYLALGMGCTITYNRSIMLLAEDLRTVKPDVLISVPRIYEKIYARINEQLGKKPAIARWLFNCAVNVGWRKFCAENKLPVPKSPWQFADSFTGPILKKLVADKVLEQFGGNLKVAIAGGAALNGKVARVFGGLGLAPIQGYGMTEASPIIAGNSLTLNQPDTVGKLFSNLQMRLAPETHEIQIRGSSIMKGYWKRPEDTARVLDSEGWLSTGDVGEINETGLLRIKGRIKEIIVTSTGEKVPPADLENAIQADSLFSQSMAVGDNRPYVSALVVMNPELWPRFAESLGLDPKDPATLLNRDLRNAVLRRIKAATANFPNYGIPRSVRIIPEAWTIENGMLTPTLKLKRRVIYAKYADEIESLYGDVRSQR